MQSIADAATSLASAAAPHGVLLTTFTDAGGYLTALNWALHVRGRAGCTPTTTQKLPELTWPRDIAAQGRVWVLT